MRYELKKGARAVCLLKGLYGLKQAPRLTDDGVSATVHRHKFSSSYSDPCLYARKEKSEFMVSALCADNLT